jgi:tetratricopeptide (TPR) repeat protein
MAAKVALRVSLILALLVTLGTRVALAQAPADDEKRAREFFALGRYADALEVYGRLYAETAHPTYLRNIGRCFQNLGEPDKAISSFREYLRQARNLTPDQRTQVEGYIREMEELKRKREAPPPPPQPLPITKEPPPPDPGPVTPPDAPLDGRRLGAYLAAGGAVVALGVGTAFGLRALSKRKDSDPLCPGDRCDQRGYELDRQAHRAALVSDVAFGAGLVAAGVATYLFLASPDAPGGESPRRVEVKVAIGPRAASVGLGARW